MNKNRDRMSRNKVEQSKEIHFIVTEATELLEFLLLKLAGKGRNQVKALLAREQVTVDGNKVTQYNHPLAYGQRVSIDSSRTLNQEPIRGLSILYEDSDVIVIDKQAGLLSIATPKEKIETAYYLLTEHVRKAHPRNRIFIIHRLDRDTSGVMMYAKSKEVQQSLQNSWHDSVPHRKYVAAVEGSVHQVEGTVTSWLKENKSLKMYSSPTDNGGLKAVTHFKTLHKTRAYSLLEITLETGRKNQIRVHMEEIGHSVIGDKKYGSSRNPIGRLGLHAFILGFLHPTSGELMSFKSEIPDSFMRLFKQE